MSKDRAVQVDAALVNAGDLDGSMCRVSVTLDDIFEALDSKHLADEIHERLGTSDPVMIELRNALVPDDEPEDDWGDERGEDEMFRPLGDWDKAELLKAIREDDGRRCIDVLKRAAAR